MNQTSPRIYFETKIHMIKYFICICFVVPNWAFAQIEFGITGGYNIARASFKTEYKTTHTSGLNAGLFVNTHLYNNLSAQIEILQTTKGFQETGFEAWLFRYREIAVPLIVQYELGRIKIGVGHESALITSITNIVLQALPSKFDHSILGYLHLDIFRNLSVNMRYVLAYKPRDMFSLFNDNNPRLKTLQLGLSYRILKSKSKE